MVLVAATVEGDGLDAGLDGAPGELGAHDGGGGFLLPLAAGPRLDAAAIVRPLKSSMI